MTGMDRTEFTNNKKSYFLISSSGGLLSPPLAWIGLKSWFSTPSSNQISLPVFSFGWLVCRLALVVIIAPVILQILFFLKRKRCVVFVGFAIFAFLILLYYEHLSDCAQVLMLIAPISPSLGGRYFLPSAIHGFFLFWRWTCLCLVELLLSVHLGIPSLTADSLTGWLRRF